MVFEVSKLTKEQVQGDCQHKMLCDSSSERDNGCIDANIGECVHYQPGVWAECSTWNSDE